MVGRSSRRFRSSSDSREGLFRAPSIGIADWHKRRGVDRIESRRRPGTISPVEDETSKWRNADVTIGEVVRSVTRSSAGDAGVVLVDDSKAATVFQIGTPDCVAEATQFVHKQPARSRP